MYGKELSTFCFPLTFYLTRLMYIFYPKREIKNSMKKSLINFYGVCYNYFHITGAKKAI